MPLLLAAPTAYAAGDAILFEPFDSAQALADAGATVGERVSFVTGREGNAVRLPEGARIDIPLPDRFHPRRGTIEFYVRPDWPGDDDARHCFINIGGGHRHITIFKTQDGRLCFVYKGGQQFWRAAQLDVNLWKPRRWHHVLATWFPASDDRLGIILQADDDIAVASDVVALTTAPRYINVGERNGPAGPEPAMAALDSLRITVGETIPPLPQRDSHHVVRVDAASPRGPLPRVFDFFTPWNSWRNPVPFDVGSPTYERMKEAGFRMVRLAALGRIWLTGADVTRDPDGRLHVNFDVLDPWVEVFTSAGIEPYFRLGYDMPKVMSASDSDDPRIWAKSPPRDYREWEDLCYRIVRHYNVEKKVGARYWVVWNEPDLKGWWKGTIDEWLDLYRYAVRGAKRADPTVKVGGPATTARVVQGTSLEYLIALLRTCRREDLPLDFIAFHGYKKQHPREYETLIRRVREIVEREYPGLRPEYFLDEWNLWSNDKRQDNEYGAAYVAAALHYQMRAGLAKSSYVSLNHHAPVHNRSIAYGQPGSAFGSLPMIKGNVLTPVYFVFRMYNQLGDDWLSLSIDGGDDVTPDDCLGAVATRRDNEIAVLVWHFDRERGDLSQVLDRPEFAHTRRVTIRLSRPYDALHSRRARVSRYLIDAQHSNAYYDYIVRKTPSDDGQYNINTGRLALVEETLITLRRGQADVEVALPNLSVTLVRLAPA